MEYAVMADESLASGEARRVVVEGKGIAVVRTSEGKLYALRDVCPHQGAPLSGGIVEPMIDGDAPGNVWMTKIEVLRCPWHHYEYDLNTGLALGDPECKWVKTYSVSVVDGQIVLTV